MPRIFRLLKAFQADRRGTLAVKFAMAAPVIALISMGGIDLQSVHASSVRLQDIADSAALAGGRELGLAVDTHGPIARAEDFVRSQIGEWDQAPHVDPRVAVIEVDGQRALKVEIEGRRPSFFGNLLPPGGWRLHVEATASSVALAPLCVLTNGAQASDALWLRDRSGIDADVCLIHSNRRVLAADRSHILAAVTQSVQGAVGNIQTAPLTGAPAIPDPYVNLKPRVPASCPILRRVIEYRASSTLAAGVHCHDIVVSGTATLTLAPGEHYFSGNRLLLRQNARLNGQNVVMMFDRAAFDFLDQSRVTLGGRRTGRYAGFVLIGLRPPGGFCLTPPQVDNGGGGLLGGLVGVAGNLIGLLDSVRPKDCRLGSEFMMASDNVEALDGVIYFPSSKLIVQGTSDIAEGSDWTVMVVEALEVRGSPRLVINADYDESAVPVPRGVGPGNMVHLVR